MSTTSSGVPEPSRAVTLRQDAPGSPHLPERTPEVSQFNFDDAGEG